MREIVNRHLKLDINKDHLESFEEIKENEKSYSNNQITMDAEIDIINRNQRVHRFDN